MTARLRHLSASDSPDAIVEVLEQDGAVIVEGLLDADLLARFNAQLDPQLAAASPIPPHLNDAIDFFLGKKTRRLGALATRAPAFVDVLLHPLFRAVCDHFLLPACARYQLNVGQVIDVGPGADAQMLHRDEDVWVHVPRPAPIFQVASVTALADFSSENGATRIVPGSHRWERERQAEPDEVVQAEMSAGSSVVYLGRTIHGAGANMSVDTWRRGLHLSYLVGWLRTEENNYLGAPPRVARKLPREAQELLGYAVHDAIAAGGGPCGYLEFQDPVDLLESGAEL